MNSKDAGSNVKFSPFKKKKLLLTQILMQPYLWHAVENTAPLLIQQ